MGEQAVKSVVTTGRTVEEAVTSALVKLGVTRSQAKVRIISEPVKGILGWIGGRPAQVEVSIEEKPDEVVLRLMRNLFDRLSMTAVVRCSYHSESDVNELMINVEAEEDVLPYLIGHHGNTLDALQNWLTLAYNKQMRDTSFSTVKINMDIGNYREKRKQKLIHLADIAAEKATQLKKVIFLEPMVAVDRKLIHEHFQNRSDIRTESEGKEPNRRIKIIPVDHD